MLLNSASSSSFTGWNKSKCFKSFSKFNFFNKNSTKFHDNDIVKLLLEIPNVWLGQSPSGAEKLQYSKKKTFSQKVFQFYLLTQTMQKKQTRQKLKFCVISIIGRWLSKVLHKHTRRTCPNIIHKDKSSSSFW